MRKSIAQNICVCGFLTALAVLFQSSPVFIPIAGLFLSPFATLPIALAACRSKSSGLASFISAAIILLAVYPQESFIFIFSTGIMGFSLGIHYSKAKIRSISTTACVLFLGMNALAYLLGINLFGDFIKRSSFLDSIIPYALFSFIYSTIWVFIIKYFTGLLIRLKLFEPNKPG